MSLCPSVCLSSPKLKLTYFSHQRWYMLVTVYNIREISQNLDNGSKKSEIHKKTELGQKWLKSATLSASISPSENCVSSSPLLSMVLPQVLKACMQFHASMILQSACIKFCKFDKSMPLQGMKNWKIPYYFFLFVKPSLGVGQNFFCHALCLLSQFQHYTMKHCSIFALSS